MARWWSSSRRPGSSRCRGSLTRAAELLRDQDTAVLDELRLPYEVEAHPGFVNVVINEYPTATGLQPATTTLLVRLPLGFPDATPDMFWCDPPVLAGTG